MTALSVVHGRSCGQFAFRDNRSHDGCQSSRSDDRIGYSESSPMIGHTFCKTSRTGRHISHADDESIRRHEDDRNRTFHSPDGTGVERGAARRQKRRTACCRSSSAISSLHRGVSPMLVDAAIAIRSASLTRPGITY